MKKQEILCSYNYYMFMFNELKKKKLDRNRKKNYTRFYNKV